MASAELSRRVEKVVGYPPLVEMDDRQRREFHEALLDADSFEDLPGEWEAAIIEAAQNRRKLRVVSGDESYSSEVGSRSPGGFEGQPPLSMSLLGSTIFASRKRKTWGERLVHVDDTASPACVDGDDDQHH
jgi:hypothetical protein